MKDKLFMQLRTLLTVYERMDPGSEGYRQMGGTIAALTKDLDALADAERIIAAAGLGGGNEFAAN